MPNIPSDRKLGDEWDDWDGSSETVTQAPAGLFLFFTGIAALGLGILGLLLGWMIYPRMTAMQLGFFTWVLAVLWIGYLVVWYLGILLASWGMKAFKKPVQWLGGIRWIMTLSIYLGSWFGISRDRMAHALLLVHNRLEVLPPLISDPAKLLVLAPRCLSREIMQALRGLQEEYHFTMMVAVGGTEARRAITEIGPQGIVAVACERDLLSGVKDVGGKVPIWSIANERPEGPCKNTRINLHRLEEIVSNLVRFKGNQGQSISTH